MSYFLYRKRLLNYVNYINALTCRIHSNEFKLPLYATVDPFMGMNESNLYVVHNLGTNKITYLIPYLQVFALNCPKYAFINLSI